MNPTPTKGKSPSPTTALSEPNFTTPPKQKSTEIEASLSRQEKKLRNTFGWARIDVMSMLICCIFIASLVFSLFVAAFQTLFHIDHNEQMHHPIPVLYLGCAGILLNGLCYLLIGGYTFHQGSFLYVTESGDVVLNRVVIPDVKQGARRLSRTKREITGVGTVRQRQGCREMSRDILGTFISSHNSYFRPACTKSSFFFA